MKRPQITRPPRTPRVRHEDVPVGPATIHAYIRKETGLHAASIDDAITVFHQIKTASPGPPQLWIDILGTLVFLLAAWGAWLAWRGRLERATWFHRESPLIGNREPLQVRQARAFHDSKYGVRKRSSTGCEPARGGSRR